MEQINFNKIIVKVALTTLLVVILLFGIFLGVFTLFFPKILADWSSGLGLNNISIFYYEKTYEKTQDINDLYRLLNKTIQVNDTQKIITNFEKLNNDETYYEFIDYMNNYNLSSTQNVMLKLHLTNEDARLKQNYIKALLNGGETEKAFLYIIADLQNEQFLSINDYNKLNFLATEYVHQLVLNQAENTEFEVFSEFYYNDEMVNYLNLALNYYNNVKNSYDLNLFVRQENENSFELAVISNHLKKVVSTIIFLNDTLETGLDTSALQTQKSEYELQYEQLIDELEMLQQ